MMSGDRIRSYEVSLFTTLTDTPYPHSHPHLFIASILPRPPTIAPTRYARANAHAQAKLWQENRYLYISQLASAWSIFPPNPAGVLAHRLAPPNVNAMGGSGDGLAGLEGEGGGGDDRDRGLLISAGSEESLVSESMND